MFITTFPLQYRKLVRYSAYFVSLPSAASTPILTWVIHISAVCAYVLVTRFLLLLRRDRVRFNGAFNFMH